MLQTNSAMPSGVLCEPLNYATCDYPICATCDLRCQAAISVTGRHVVFHAEVTLKIRNTLWLKV